MKGLRYLISLQDRVSATADKIGGKVMALYNKMNKVTEVQEKVAKSGAKAANGIAKIKDKVDSTSLSLQKYLKWATIAGAVMIGVNTARNFIDATVEADKFRRVVEFTGKSEGVKNFEFFNQTINDLRLPLRESREGFMKMSGAFMDTSLAGQPMRDLFEGTAMASRALGMSGEETGGAILALGQMMSKGTVSAEELRGQLGERLYGAFNLASKAIGVTQVKLNELLQKGSVVSEKFLPQFARQLKITFADEAIKAAKSPQAVLDALNNKYLLLKETIGSKLMPKFLEFANVVLEKSDQIITDLSAGIDKLKPFADAVAEYINGKVEQMKPTLLSIGENLQQTILPIQGFLASVFGFLDVLFTMIGELIGMQATTIDWGGLLAETFNILSSILGSLTTIFSGLWKILKPFVGLFLKFVGLIISDLAGFGLKVLEKVADWFKILADNVSFVARVFENLLKYFGLMKDTKVTLVQEKVDKSSGQSWWDKLFGSKKSEQGVLPPSTSTTGAAPSGIKGTSEKINQGGSRPVNISVQYGSMVSGGITIQTTNLQQGAKDIEKILQEMLLRTLNGATQLAVG